MLSPRRTAQLGLTAACLTLVTCITVLVAGAKDDANSPSATKTQITSISANPLTNNPNFVTVASK